MARVAVDSCRALALHSRATRQNSRQNRPASGLDARAMAGCGGFSSPPGPRSRARRQIRQSPLAMSVSIGWAKGRPGRAHLHTTPSPEVRRSSRRCLEGWATKRLRPIPSSRERARPQDASVLYVRDFRVGDTARRTRLAPPYYRHSSISPTVRRLRRHRGAEIVRAEVGQDRIRGIAVEPQRAAMENISTHCPPGGSVA